MKTIFLMYLLIIPVCLQAQIVSNTHVCWSRVFWYANMNV